MHNNDSESYLQHLLTGEGQEQLQDGGAGFQEGKDAERFRMEVS
jgi:hypothetical protein